MDSAKIDFLRPDHTFIIAEAGVNHNGDVALAHQLIDIAADADADAVKFQTFRAEGVATAEATKAEYQVRTTGSDGDQLTMIRALELSENYYPKLIEHCHERGIMFMSTPHDWEAIDILDRLDVTAFKVGSGDLTNLPFLKQLSRKGRPIILSTGMGNISEVEEAVETIRSEGNNRLVLLHCVTSYPAKDEDCNLNAMLTLKQAFQTPVGYSDHTSGVAIALAAVALGARVIEKHFTLDSKMTGPDHEASLEPDELRSLVLGIRRVDKAMGDGIKRPVEVEHGIMVVARKSIVAACDIPANVIITQDMITTKRPGSGILPRYWDDIIGSRSKTPISKDSLIKWNQVGD
jgi:N,N'-diacetyllegionaminate synthase